MASQLTRRDDSGSNRYVTRPEFNTALPQAWSSWSPTITASSGTFTSVAANRARFIQVGKTIQWSLVLTITTAGTAGGYLQFSLPVTAASPFAEYIGTGRALVPASSVVAQVFLTGTTTARVSRYDDSTIIGSGYVLTASGMYEAA